MVPFFPLIHFHIIDTKRLESRRIFAINRAEWSINMKRGIGKSLSLAFVLVGTLIGAGFATGQEIYTFFVKYTGYPGWFFTFSCGLIILGSICCYFYNKEHGIRSYEEYLCSMLGKKAGQIAYLISVLFLLACFCVTVSGSGALFEESLHMPYWFGAAVILVVSFTTLLYGMSGIFFVNSILTPVIIVCILFLGTTAFFGKGTEVFASVSMKYLTPPLVFAFLYSGYNAFSVLPISISSAGAGLSNRQALTGYLLAFLFLLPVGWIIIGCLNLPGIQPELYELPFLQAVASLSKHSESIYGLALYFAMITTAVSCFYGFVYAVAGSFQFRRSAVMLAGCAAAAGTAFFPFSMLVGKLYSFFGIFGVLLLMIAIYRYLALKWTQRCDKIMK